MNMKSVVLTINEILTLIEISEKLATVIDAAVNASTNTEESAAWEHARSLYLDGLAAVKAKIREDEA